MALDEYHHGVRVAEVNNGTRSIRTVATSIIGLIAIASDADATLFPLNTPVLVTNIQSVIGKAGVLGTLKSSLQAIVDQTNTTVVVVRVDSAEAEAEQSSLVIGTTTASGQYTGLKALLTAKAKLGVTPRLIGAPGLDTQAVTTALVSTAQKLRAFAYAYAYGCETKEEVVAYRESFAARELMLIWPQFIRFNTETSQNEAISPVAYALGLRAKIDNLTGWHKVISNVAVNGVVGISKDVWWDLQQTGTDADYLNSNGITTLIREDGFRFWGSRTCDTDGLFPFENYTRTAQIIADTIAEAHMWAVDKPLHPSLASDLIEGIRAKLSDLTTNGYLMGGEAWYDETKNPVENLKAGKFRLSYDYGPVPPLEDLGFYQMITDDYLADFGARITA
ncbi:phage tail sheath protein [Acinetobacter sp. ANC 4173]|uniref:phage tail sheath protein n=1 Tax=Acinetobacter sp. ANC 4173 TaxID=2529837 RepID=UPI00103BDCD6|nr:phage tail sheath protein [Acinetobacter sp. ANC 4173]TCB81654.1 phage tail sheath protein [Acinetobacter sp. ANC 4173]